MDYLVVTAELRVLVADGVEAVRALGDHLLHPVLLEGLVVLQGQLLEHVLVARPSSRVPVADLTHPEAGEADAGRVEKAGYGDRHGRVPVVVRAGAPNDPQ